MMSPLEELWPAVAKSQAPFLKRSRRALRFGLIRLSLGLFSTLPIDLAAFIGRWLGVFAFWLFYRERKKALDSLATAFPHRPPHERWLLAKRCFAHLGQAAAELCCVAQLDASMEERIRWAKEDRAVLDQALQEGRGVLFVSGHLGNWELLARRVAKSGYPSQSIAKETSDPQLTGLVERFRQAGKVGSIWRGHPGAVRQMLRALKEGEILGMLIDQDTRVQSLFVPFFGKPAKTPRAAADLALRTGCPVVMGFCTREADAVSRYRVSLRRLSIPASTGSREADAWALTAAMTAEIEAAIFRAPEQWVWMHRRWKSQP